MEVVQIGKQGYNFNFMFCCCGQTQGAKEHLRTFFYCQTVLNILALAAGLAGLNTSGWMLMVSITLILLWISGIISAVISRQDLERREYERVRVAAYINCAINVISTVAYLSLVMIFLIITLSGASLIAGGSGKNGASKEYVVLFLGLASPFIPFMLMWLCQLMLMGGVFKAIRELDSGYGQVDKI